MTASESGPSISRKFKLIAWVPICGFLIIPACGERNVYVPPPPPMVTVSQPVLRSVVDRLEFTGNTQAINTVELRARVQGYLEKVYFKDGDVVKKGQHLFLIQQDTYQAQLKQAEAQILQQKANLEHATVETARYDETGTKAGGLPDGPGQLAVSDGTLTRPQSLLRRPTGTWPS